MKCVDDFRLRLGNKELVPIMIGGMGVDISTVELALEAARLGGVGHISDAMVPTVIDRHLTRTPCQLARWFALGDPQVANGLGRLTDQGLSRRASLPRRLDLGDAALEHKEGELLIGKR